MAIDTIITEGFDKRYTPENCKDAINEALKKDMDSLGDGFVEWAKKEDMSEVDWKKYIAKIFADEILNLFLSWAGRRGISKENLTEEDWNNYIFFLKENK